jgi:hypothetical protein
VHRLKRGLLLSVKIANFEQLALGASYHGKKKAAPEELLVSF